ncbi:unnamed protein product [Rotaria socialis]|uniref:B box-type domain-containing protein n=1 Tax=Rotaria socialis TaxID=392032 RepID=A0A820S367_9BILA|nr:unnamed protein product [Rotaria socialis]CAF4445507.1 unnamed protein product [Rotaria socialis]
MTSPNYCSACYERDGTCYCSGCKDYFCDDDFKSHREMLINKLNEFTADRNDLQKNINKDNSNQRSVLDITAKIDEWEERTIEKVKQVADLAKKQVVKIINSNQEEIAIRFRNLSKELGDRRVKKSVLEHDITRLKQEIYQLKEDVIKMTHTSTIELNMKQSDKIEWNRMTYVEGKPITPCNQWHQLKPIEIKSIGEGILLENAILLIRGS